MTIGDYAQASTWYRIGQYLPFLESRGFNVEKFFLDRVGEYDLVIVQKVLLPTSLAKKIVKKARRIIFDFDDAIWTRPGKDFSFITKWRVNKRLAVWLEGADAVLVPNKVLEAKALSYTNKVHVLPMAIDIAPYKKRDKTPAIMGWSGAPHNLPYVEAILPAIKKVEGKLSIYSGKKPNFPCEHIPFTVGGEAPYLEQVGVGLLPLPLDAYSRGKSPIKALQYMAAGIPFVYSGSGGIEEMVDPSFAFRADSEEEWVNLLTKFLKDETFRNQAGVAARTYVERYFSVSCQQEKLLKVISVC